jgi:hypothetical protein
VITSENNHWNPTSIVSSENNVLPSGDMPCHLQEKYATTIKVGHIERHAEQTNENSNYTGWAQLWFI